MKLACTGAKESKEPGKKTWEKAVRVEGKRRGAGTFQWHRSGEENGRSSPLQQGGGSDGETSDEGDGAEVGDGDAD